MKFPALHRIAPKVFVVLLCFCFLLALLFTLGETYIDGTIDDKIAKVTFEKVSSPKTPALDSAKDSGEASLIAQNALVMPARSNLTRHFFNLLVENGIKILLVAGCFFLIFQYLVTRHLEALAAQIVGLNCLDPQSSLRLSRQKSPRADELETIVEGLNSFLSEAQQVYDTLSNNERRMLLFLDATEEAIVGVDQDAQCTFANSVSLRMLKIDNYEAIVGKNLHALMRYCGKKPFGGCPDGCLICMVLGDGSIKQSDDGVLSLPDGTTRFVSLRGYPVFADGKTSGAIFFISDTSEKRRLRREHELLSEAVEQVPVMIIIADSENRIQYANNGAERLTGFTRQELINRSIFFDAEKAEEGSASIADIANILSEGIQWEGVLKFQAKSGKTLTLFSVMSPVFDDQQRIANVISVAREVSYDIALQKEHVNAKKMEAVGRLSANFTHEFGNPLFGIRSVIRDICDRLPLSEEDKTLLELAHGECERMRNMVREFQKQYSETVLVREVGDSMVISMGKVGELAVIIEDVLESCATLMAASNVDYVIEYGDKSHAVVVNKSRLSLVLWNVIVNAIESMNKIGGTLRVATALSGQLVTITIGDSGCGIKKEHQEFVFEPFFTTKQKVEGTGLGLPVAYGIMKNLGGTITFTSEEGLGSTFYVYLPIA